MTDELWWLGDLPLAGPAFRLQTQPDGPVPMRGDDLEVANRDGRMWQPKMLDARTLTLTVQVSDEDGYGRSGRDVYLANRDRLYAALYSPGLQLRRLSTMPDGRLSDRRIGVEPAGGFDLDTLSHGRFGRVGMQLFAADPRWYEHAEVVLEGLSGTSDVPNQGTVRHRRGRLRIHGPVTDPTVGFAPAGTSTTWVGTLTAGQWVELDAEATTVVDHASVSRAASVVRQQPALFEIGPGLNTVTLSGGTCDLAFRMAWL